jgi:hypothetical protein
MASFPIDTQYQDGHFFIFYTLISKVLFLDMRRKHRVITRHSPSAMNPAYQIRLPCPVRNTKATDRTGSTSPRPREMGNAMETRQTEVKKAPATTLIPMTRKAQE